MGVLSLQLNVCVGTFKKESFVIHKKEKAEGLFAKCCRAAARFIDENLNSRNNQERSLVSRAVHALHDVGYKCISEVITRQTMCWTSLVVKVS